MNIYERNIAVFKENRELVLLRYRKQTELMVKNTRVYKSPLKCKIPNTHGGCQFEFTNNDTISTVLYNTRMGYNVCALNFADALNPGGLVEYGELTQEEDLCRCSNLYESLVKTECVDEYYTYNRNLGNSIYSDRIIFSKDVSIIRESLHYSLLDKPLKCSIVTCPAPIVYYCEDYYNVIKNRIRGIFSVMASNGFKVIVLGAWGCGAFGGNANIVSKVFAEVMKEFHCFNRIIYSIKSTELDKIDNYTIFRRNFYDIFGYC